MVGYFIPGVRHFTAIVAGTSKLELHSFALFAYSGATLWVSTFVFLGYHFGPQSIAAGVIVIAYFLARFLISKRVANPRS